MWLLVTIIIVFLICVGFLVVYLIQYPQQTVSSTNTPSQVKCVFCGSTQIQLVPRRWSLLTGFFTNKTDRICLNCKRKF